MSRNPQFSHLARTAAYTIGTVLIAIFSGCNRSPQIATYDAPKDPPPRAHAEMAASNLPTVSAGAAADSAAPQIRWQAPQHWRASQPAAAAAANVRVGSFTITATDGSGHTADLAITTFPGDVGGDLANINRWRGQLKLAPITAAQLPDAYTTITAPAGEFLIADMTSNDAPKKRTLGAWYKQTAQNRTWFIKLTGDAGLVGNEREAFLAFLLTITFDSAAH